jgi:CHAT domain-containing protein
MVENRPGDEPIGLVKAFITLGCEAFVCTSWATLDSSAKDLRIAFYEALIRRKTVAESARLARRQVLKWSTAGKYPEKASIVHWGPLMTFSRLHFKLT